VLLGKTLDQPIFASRKNMAVVAKVSVPPVKACTVDCKFYNIIIRASRRYNVEPEIIKAIIRAESSFNPKAISNKGAMGLMQLMPITAEELGVKDAFNPEHNINGGVRYYKKLLRRYKGDVKLALAAYNAGVLRVKQYNGVPPFKATRLYIEKVIKYYSFYKKQMDRDQAGTAVAER
jgi:soluble lytic murein transglycosylase-like protein